MYVNIIFIILVISYYILFMIFIKKKLGERLNETK